jgi:lipopolysaccharide export system permease protein
MRILVGYFSRVLGVRIIAVLLSFVALLVLMDLIDNVEGVLERRGSLVDIFLFAGYRLPTIVERLLPLSVLIGSTMGILALASHSELIVLRASGVSQIKIAAFGIPVCLMVVLAHFVLADRIAPTSERAFLEWWEPQKIHQDTLWLRGEGSLVRIGAIAEEARALEDIDIFERDEMGVLTSRLSAASAKYENAQWTLFDVGEIALGRPRAEVSEMDVKAWPNGPKPEIILDLVAVPDQLTKGTLEKILLLAWSSTAEPSVYSTELARRSAGPLASLVMMLIAASTIRGHVRSGSLQLGAMSALAIGLMFLVFEGITASLGKAGVLAPTIAAWSPLVMFTGIAGFLLFRFER